MDLETGTLFNVGLSEVSPMLDSPERARVVWSAIAEPGDRRTGALIQELGPQAALGWATQLFTMPTVDGVPIPDPESTSGPQPPYAAAGTSGLSRVWERVHQRLQPRIADFSYDKELSALDAVGGRIIFPGDPDWPSKFSLLEERAPFALWVAGTLPAVASPSVALVGARAATSYGVAMAGTLGFDSVSAGLTVISGGAFGIDAAAHRGAVRAGPTIDCPTVAVLCGGLGNPYPVGNAQLFEEIVEKGGALVTEMPPSARPARWRFLARNRLISAWSDMVVVVEAGLRSGALATANRAADIGVTVGAVPGAVTSVVSRGPNELLKNGADVVTDVDDILFQVIGDIRAESKQPKKAAGKDDTDGDLARLSPVQRRVWEGLPARGEASVLKVASQTGLSKVEAAGALGALQSYGLVKRTERGWGRKART